MTTPHIGYPQDPVIATEVTTALGWREDASLLTTVATIATTAEGMSPKLTLKMHLLTRDRNTSKEVVLLLNEEGSFQQHAGKGTCEALHSGEDQLSMILEGMPWMKM